MEREGLIQSWFETDQNDEETINDIVQEEVPSETKEDIEEG